MEMGRRRLSFILVFNKCWGGRVRETCHIEKPTSEKYYPKTLIINIVQNHYYSCASLLHFVFHRSVLLVFILL